MQNQDINNGRIARNTVFLYFRMILLMLISLYASRVLLRTLGVNDYGLYNVVGSAVALLGFLNATLSTSTQRFLNIELGKSNKERLKLVFSTSLLLHLFLVFIVFIIAETIGLWYIKNYLVVPSGREFAAMCVYQFSVIAICIQIVQLPFMASIIAHERMNVYAYVSLIEGISKLLIIYVLQLVDVDHLILYAGLILGVQILVAIIYNVYCQKNFEEARFHLAYDKDLFKSMLGFSGWNVIGNVAFVCNTQGLNLVMNAFFGTIINAAQGIAFQVNGLLQQLIANFQLAVKPQVIKYYASGQVNEMIQLVFNSAKYSAYLMIIASVPLLLEIEPLLTLWLGEFPDYTIIFIQLVLLRSIVTSMTGCIIMAVHATGYLRNIGLFSGGILLTVLPISYFMLRAGLPPYIPFVLNILAAILDAFFELYWMHHYIQFPISRFYKNVYMPVFLLFFFVYSCSYILHYSMSGANEYLRMVLVMIFSVTLSCVVIYRYGLTFSVRNKIKNYISVRLGLCRR